MYYFVFLNIFFTEWIQHQHCAMTNVLTHLKLWYYSTWEYDKHITNTIISITHIKWHVSSFLPNICWSDVECFACTLSTVQHKRACRLYFLFGRPVWIHAKLFCKWGGENIRNGGHNLTSLLAALTCNSHTGARCATCAAEPSHIRCAHKTERLN